MSRIIFYGLLFVFIAGCAQSYNPDKIYESAKKKGEIVYPKFHPGDLLAHKGVSQQKTKKMMVVVVGDYVIQDFWDECKQKCTPTFNCEDETPLSREYESCKDRYHKVSFSCRDSCYDDKLKTESLAKHVEGGYYSDGSYYATIGSSFHYFSNLHPTRNKYKKSKWQKDRDECMELTFKNLGKIWPNALEYYQNCLKERGYDIN